MNCNLEVSPDTLALPAAVVDALADWATVYDAIDRLWLDSGSYEGWARTQLVDVASPVNARGRNVQAVVDGIRRCYYWYFQDEAATDYQPIRKCPVCGELLRDYTPGALSQGICECDSIVTSH